MTSENIIELKAKTEERERCVKIIQEEHKKYAHGKPARIAASKFADILISLINLKPHPKNMDPKKQYLTEEHLSVLNKKEGSWQLSQEKRNDIIREFQEVEEIIYAERKLKIQAEAKIVELQKTLEATQK